ncbi:MAG: DNA polymerase III subunit delta [Alphaproteobacteria bacterium]
MKLQPRQLAGFLREPPAATRVALIFGPDRGLVSERAAALVRVVAQDPQDPFRVVTLLPADLKEVSSRLADEYAALSFGGGRRAVRLRDAGNGEAGAVETVLELDVDGDALVIVEAGELGPRDRLRVLCEKHPAAATIACFADADSTLEALIQHSLREAGLAIDPDALAELVGRIGADRQVSRRELEKLALYKAGYGDTVGLADVEAVIGDGSPLALDDLIGAAAEGDLGRVDRVYRRCLDMGQSPVGILRGLMRHLQRLHLVAARVGQGARPEDAMKSLRPPVFGPNQARFRRQLGLWDAGRLAGALQRVWDAELACKTTGSPAAALTSRCLMQIAQAARHRG